MFQNYIFDLYGTLIDIHTDEDSSSLWKKMALIYGYRGALYTPFELINKYKEFCDQEKQELKKANPHIKYVDINQTKVFKRLYEYKKVKVSDELAAFTANAFRCYSTDHCHHCLQRRLHWFFVLPVLRLLCRWSADQWYCRRQGSCPFYDQLWLDSRRCQQSDFPLCYGLAVGSTADLRHDRLLPCYDLCPDDKGRC